MLYAFLITDTRVDEDLYWDCKANGIEPALIMECFNDGITLGELLVPEDDACAHQIEAFRQEVLNDLDDRGVEYKDGALVLTDIQNSHAQTLGVLTALTNSIR